MLGGGNISSLQTLLGHSTIQMTEKYVHMSNQYISLGEDIYRLEKSFFTIYRNNFVQHTLYEVIRIKTDEQIMDAADLNHPKLGQKIHPGDYYNPKGTRDIEKI